MTVRVRGASESEERNGCGLPDALKGTWLFCICCGVGNLDDFSGSCADGVAVGFSGGDSGVARTSSKAGRAAGSTSLSGIGGERSGRFVLWSKTNLNTAFASSIRTIPLHRPFRRVTRFRIISTTSWVNRMASRLRALHRYNASFSLQALV